jgi:phosphorylcholine metabolism protein LicD
MNNETAEQIAAKMKMLTEKIAVLERLEVDSIRDDFYEKGLFEYLQGIKNKNEWYLYSLMKHNNETFRDVKTRSIHNLAQFEYTPASIIKNTIKALLKVFHTLCQSHGLSYWFELETLDGITTFGDLYPYAEAAAVGMPSNDIERLAEIIGNNPDFRIVASYPITDNGYIKIYRFVLTRIEYLFIDLFSYHYVDSRVLKNPLQYWNEINKLRPSFAASAKQVENLIQTIPALAEKRNLLVKKYIKKQKELCGGSGDRGALFWGIENFKYHRENILDCSRMFPLQETKVWNQSVYVPKDNNWYIGLREAVRGAVPTGLRMPDDIRRIQPSQERILLDIIAKYG